MLILTVILFAGILKSEFEKRRIIRIMYFPVRLHKSSIKARIGEN
jgi:hypothetical protein